MPTRWAIMRFFADGKMIGRATSGNFGPRLGKSLALAMVPPTLASVGTELQIDVLGKMHAAVIVDESPFDTQNMLLRK